MAEKYEAFAYLQKLYDHLDLVAHVPVRNVSWPKLKIIKSFFLTLFLFAFISTDRHSSRQFDGET